jgi:hypothetical protein
VSDACDRCPHGATFEIDEVDVATGERKTWKACRCCAGKVAEALGGEEAIAALIAFEVEHSPGSGTVH